MRFHCLGTLILRLRLVIVGPLVGARSVVTGLLAFSSWVVPTVLGLHRTIPSACRSPKCFLRSSCRWLRCLLCTSHVLARSRTLPCQLLPLFPSPPPTTRAPMSFICQSCFIRGFAGLSVAGPDRRESKSVVYLGRAGLDTLGECTDGESLRFLPQGHDIGSSQKHTLLAAAATATSFFRVTASLPPAPFMAPLRMGVMHTGYLLSGPSGLFSH